MLCQVQRSKGQNNPVVHNSHGRLINPDNLKGLTLKVSEKWHGQNCHGEIEYNICKSALSINLKMII